MINELTKQRTFRYSIVAFIIAAFVASVDVAGDTTTAPIQPYAKNPWYWEYHDEPILLRGGSDEDNLFQWTGQMLTDHLDLLASVGGNYVRNTMSSRDEGNVYPFKRLDTGRYDLDQWDEEFWRRLTFFLEETARRGLIVLHTPGVNSFVAVIDVLDSSPVSRPSALVPAERP